MSTSSPPVPKSIDPAKVIDRFEGNIVFNPGSRESGYRRSEHGKKLIDAGPLILPDIGRHLLTVKDRKNFGDYDSSEDLRQAWIWLLRDIANRHGLDHPPAGKPGFEELSAWAFEHSS